MRRLAVIALLAAALAPAHADARAPNPCLTARARWLRCPDLAMRTPFGLTADTRTLPGRVLLRAGNSIDNLGAGPAELHGVRVGPRLMRGRQRIYRRAGGRLGIATGARIVFKHVPGQGAYWKWENAARFALWKLGPDGGRIRLVRTGPKVAYCLRDLERTHPLLPRSPAARVYPGCSRDPLALRRTLGTSVGWSDVYPPDYHEQWIDVTGLYGCYAYSEIADPLNHLYESNERNNTASAVVRLPYRPGRQRCPGGTRIGRPPHGPPSGY